MIEPLLRDDYIEVAIAESFIQADSKSQSTIRNFVKRTDSSSSDFRKHYS